MEASIRWHEPIPLIVVSGWFAAVENGGMHRRRAVQFGVGISTVITWVRRLRETGSVAPGKMGGHKPKAIAGAMGIRGVPHHDRRPDAQPRTARHGLLQALGPSTPPCASGRIDRGFLRYSSARPAEVAREKAVDRDKSFPAGDAISPLQRTSASRQEPPFRSQTNPDITRLPA